jgi:two-component system, OmpR family, alkaline phosphatase synthesis response regulator PhoP
VERILVIEDDADVQKALTHRFETAGYNVETCSDGLIGLQSFRSLAAKAVVLDLCLPGMSGKQVCRELREECASVPIIVLSALSEVSEKVLLLELGADDYVTKPFSPRELLARVQAHIERRARIAANDIDTAVFGNISVDFTKMAVNRNGEQILLTPQEFRLLKYLVQNPERVISRDEMLNQVWGTENYPSTRTVDNHVLRLRRKLEKDSGNPVHFQTVHAVGYRFVP